MLGSIGKFKGDDGTVIELASNGIKCRGESYSLMGVSASLEDGSALESRPTLARFLAVGFFAFAWQKKKGGEKYLIVQGPTFTWMAVANRNHIREAMKFVTLINMLFVRRRFLCTKLFSRRFFIRRRLSMLR